MNHFGCFSSLMTTACNVNVDRKELLRTCTVYSVRYSVPLGSLRHTSALYQRLRALPNTSALQRAVSREYM